MKEYIVSLDFLTSASVTAPQLSELIGIEETELTSRPVKDGIYWRFEPTADEEVRLATGIESISSRVHTQHPINLDKNIRNICLSIGVIHDQIACSVILPLPSLRILMSSFPDLVIDISMYLTNDGEKAEGSGPGN